jgi:hypothetical protein
MYRLCLLLFYLLVYYNTTGMPCLRIKKNTFCCCWRPLVPLITYCITAHYLHDMLLFTTYVTVFTSLSWRDTHCNMVPHKTWLHTYCTCDHGVSHSTATGHLAPDFVPLAGQWWACKKLILLTLVPAGLDLPTTEETGEFENFSAPSIKRFVTISQKSRWEHRDQHADNRIQTLIIVRSQAQKKKKCHPL